MRTFFPETLESVQSAMEDGEVHPSPSQRPNILTIVGADAAGKSSVLQRITQLCVKKTRRQTFCVGTFEETHGRLPSPADIGDAGILLVEEPTRAAKAAWVRRDPAHPDGPLPVEEQALLFSQDRGILYETVVLPFLARDPDGWVIQDRSVMCSLTYQAERLGGDAGLSAGLERVLAFPGNRLELEYAPRLCLVLSLEAAEAARRLAARGDRLDAFEADRPLQERAGSLYLHPAVHAPFLAYGTRIGVIDANQAPQELLRDVEAVVREELSF